MFGYTIFAIQSLKRLCFLVYESSNHNLANALLDLGQPHRAIEHYVQACRLKPDYVKAYNNLGQAWEAAGEIPVGVSPAKSKPPHQTSQALRCWHRAGVAAHFRKSRLTN